MMYVDDAILKLSQFCEEFERTKKHTGDNEKITRRAFTTIGAVRLYRCSR